MEGIDLMSILFAEDVLEMADQVNLSSILQYESHGHTFYVDERTRRIDGIYHVKPVGKTCNDYYYALCPDCGRFEPFHKTDIKKNRPVKARCSDRIGRWRCLLSLSDPVGERKIIRVPLVAYIIDLDGWDQQ